MSRWTCGPFVVALPVALLTLGAWSVAAEVGAQRDGQDLQTGTASISGVILSADSGRPVALARVALAPDTESSGSNPVEPHATTTDASGRYQFRELRAGSYHLSASAPSYLFTSYGQHHPRGKGALIELSAGQNLKMDLHCRTVRRSPGAS